MKKRLPAIINTAAVAAGENIMHPKLPNLKDGS